MNNKDLKQEILNRYGNSSLVVDLRSLVKEKELLKAEGEHIKKESLKKTKIKKTKIETERVKKEFNFKLPGFKFGFSKKEKGNLFENKNNKLKLKSPNLKKTNNFFRNLKTIKKDKEEAEKTSFFNLKNIFKNHNEKKKKNKILKQLIEKRKKFLNSKINEFLSLADIKITISKKEKKKKKSFLTKLPVFAVILLFLVVPLKVFSSLGILDFKKIEERVFSYSYKGVNNLMAASDALSRFDFKEAEADLTEAGLNFLAADDDLGKINDAIFSLASLLPDPKMKLASQSRNFLSAGFSASSLGKNLIFATDALFSGEEDFSKSLDDFILYGNLALKDAQNLKKIVSEIDEDSLPEDYRLKFIALKTQVGVLSDSLGEFLALSDKLKDLLGLSNDKRYLLVFQNNSELRASGGFLGSYALVDLRNGKIRNLEVPAGGSYDLEAGLGGKRFASPYPLHLVNPLWNFWDANWWPDWPKTAKNLMWFYEQSSGPSVDGVISLTPTIVEKVLEITGPIDMSSEYGLIIDSENFWETVQKVVEYKNLELTHPEDLIGLPASSTPLASSIPLVQDLKNNKDNKPKKIIGDLMAKILEVLPSKITKENLPEIISIFEESVLEKQIMLYLSDENLQKEVRKYNLAGEVKSYNNDYLLIVDSNIAGQKTDRVIEKEVLLDSFVNEAGEIINTLKIERHHFGQKNAVLTGVRNVNWLRIYVPYGSTLISADGFRAPDPEYFDESDEDAIIISELENEYLAERDPLSDTLIYEEDGKTVFANWTMTDPGEVSEIIISYKLPYNFFNLVRDEKGEELSWLKKISKFLNKEEGKLFPYSLLIQKQPGAKAFNISAKMNLPLNYEIFWQAENLDAPKNYLFNFKNSLNKDRFYGLIIKKSQE